nr:hypothetical protein [Tanacetum cinerariifolium]
RDAAIADAAIATSGINDDDDDTAPMDSQPHEPRGSPHDTQTMPPGKSTRGNPPPPPITFRGNEGAVGLIRWIEKTEIVFTVSKCTEANKVVFAVATFQDRALTWWNSQVATLGIEVVTRKTWAKIKVMMTEEFCPPEEIQRMEATLNKAERMTHTLMEQKVKAIAEREADNKKRKWENFQGGSSSCGGNNNITGTTTTTTAT